MAKKPKEEQSTLATIDGDDLMRFIERRERLAEEKKDLSEQEKEINAEMKGRGYNMKCVNRLIKLRAVGADKVNQEDEEFEVYKNAAGIY